MLTRYSVRARLIHLFHTTALINAVARARASSLWRPSSHACIADRYRGVCARARARDVALLSTSVPESTPSVYVYVETRLLRRAPRRERAQEFARFSHKRESVIIIRAARWENYSQRIDRTGSSARGKKQVRKKEKARAR